MKNIEFVDKNLNFSHKIRPKKTFFYSNKQFCKNLQACSFLIIWFRKLFFKYIEFMLFLLLLLFFHMNILYQFVNKKLIYKTTLWISFTHNFINQHKSQKWNSGPQKHLFEILGIQISQKNLRKRFVEQKKTIDSFPFFDMLILWSFELLCLLF